MRTSENSVKAKFTHKGQSTGPIGHASGEGQIRDRSYRQEAADLLRGPLAPEARCYVRFFGPVGAHL
jgi:hypothetical protein